VLLVAPSVFAADAEHCGQLLDHRNALATRAMAEEIRLAGSVRERLCPELNRRAEQAQGEALSPPAALPEQTPFDFGAYAECRHRAEQELARTYRVLHRNLLGFPFYSAAGAELARRSDALLAERRRQGCPRAR
jgi:hypothetical protein